MSDATNRFYNSIEGVDKLTQGQLIDFFAYFVTVEMAEPSVTSSRLKECFEACDLKPPARIPQHLNEGLKASPPKYVRAGGGYRLQRQMRDKLAKALGAETVTVQISTELRRLELLFPDGSRKNFLKATIDCFEAGSNRATVIMCWILTLDHLFEYIINHKLAEFNQALAGNADKRIKVATITHRDDLSEIPEAKFIEFRRIAKIISNDIRKILLEKLGIRNSAAHPSGVQIKRSKAIEFVEDLVTNVILKYSV
jgi:hypothetical protein